MKSSLKVYVIKSYWYELKQFPSVGWKAADTHHLTVSLGKLCITLPLDYVLSIISYQKVTDFLFPNAVLLSVPKGPPSATIVASPSRAKVSDGIHVACTVLGEPDVDVSFSWQYPGQEVRDVCLG